MSVRYLRQRAAAALATAGLLGAILTMTPPLASASASALPKAPATCSVGVDAFDTVRLGAPSGLIAGVTLATSCQLKAPLRLWISSPTKKRFAAIVFRGNGRGQVGNGASGIWRFKDSQYVPGHHYIVAATSVRSADGSRKYVSEPDRFKVLADSTSRIIDAEFVNDKTDVVIFGQNRVYSFRKHRMMKSPIRTLGYAAASGSQYTLDTWDTPVYWNSSDGSTAWTVDVLCGLWYYALVIPTTPTVYGSVSSNYEWIRASCGAAAATTRGSVADLTAHRTPIPAGVLTGS